MAKCRCHWHCLHLLIFRLDMFVFNICKIGRGCEGGVTKIGSLLEANRIFVRVVLVRVQFWGITEV